MKKIFLIILFMLMIVTISDVKAVAEISVTPKDQAVQTKYGYKSQKQTVRNLSCDGNVEIFCIDHGLANQKTFNNCSIANVTDSIYGQVNGDFYDREYLYRVISNIVGTTKVNYNGSSVGDYKNYLPSNTLEWTDKIPSAPLPPDKDAYFSHKSNKISDTQYSVVITVSTETPGISREKFSVTSGKITDFSDNNGVYTITVLVEVEKCKGANFKLLIDSATLESEQPGTPRKYLAKCPNQNYIIEMSGECSISDLTTNSHGSLEYEIKIDDETCVCKGEVGFTGECSDGSVSDKKTDFLSCVENGSFKTYCGRELKKTQTVAMDNRTQVSSTRSSLTSATLANNPYCAVYCTEDINYDLPGIIETDNGRYFKLKEGWNIKEPNSGKNISLTGKRTCYSSKINKDTFVSDIKKNQSDIVDAVNNYLLEKAKEDAKNNVTSSNRTNNTGCAEWVDKKDQSKGCKVSTTCTYTLNSAKSSYEYKQYEITNCNSTDGTCTATVAGTQTYEYEWISNSTCPGVANGTPLEANPDKGAIDTANEALNNTLDTYKSCFEWGNNYCFNPIIEFSYDEVYNGSINDESGMAGELGKLKSENLGTTENYFTNVNSNYEGAPNSYTTSNKTYLYGKTDSVSTTFTQIDTTNRYVAKSVTKKTTYKDATKEVYSYHPYGTILEENITTNKDKCLNGNCKKLGYVFPVALEHENDTGIYNYYLHIYNVGVPGNDNSCSDETKFDSGIMGDSKCSLFNSEGTAATDKEYTCQYTTKKCPECEIECVCPDGSTNCYVENKVCKYVLCPECEIECVGCIWNNGDTTISYKNISLDDVYKDDSNIGSNWTQEDVEKIEDKGQEIYDSEPMYSFTLTPSTMAKIRNYNELSIEGNNKNVPKGGYNNDTLICKDGKNCKSTFLREYLPKSAVNIIPEN